MQTQFWQRREEKGSQVLSSQSVLRILTKREQSAGSEDEAAPGSSAKPAFPWNV